MRGAHSSWVERNYKSKLWRAAFFLSPCLSIPSSEYMLWALSVSKHWSRQETGAEEDKLPILVEMDFTVDMEPVKIKLEE